MLIFSSTLLSTLLLLLSVVIPARSSGAKAVVCDITHYGATTGTRDQGADVGVAIMRAYHECILKHPPGGTILIPAGREYRIMSHVDIRNNPPFNIQWDGTLHLALLFTLSGVDTSSAIFHFQDVKSIRIFGKGSFEGYGQLYRPNGVSHSLTFSGRPEFFHFEGASDVSMTGLSLHNSPSFHITYNGQDGYFSKIKIADNGVLAGTTDGIGLSCQRCTVEDSYIRNGDDCVVVKSPSSDIVVRRVECHDGNGVGLGTVGPNGHWDVSNVLFSDIKMFNTVGCYIKSYPGATGSVRAIKFENIQGQNVKYMIWVTHFFMGVSSPENAMTWEDISFTNVRGTTTSMKKARILIHCNSKSSCNNIRLKDVDIQQLGGKNTPNLIQNAHVVGLPSSGSPIIKSANITKRHHRHNHLLKRTRVG